MFIIIIESETEAKDLLEQPDASRFCASRSWPRSLSSYLAWMEETELIRIQHFPTWLAHLVICLAPFLLPFGL